MNPGLFTLCLDVKNLGSMRRFYEALGFEVHTDQPTNVAMSNGDVDIALMTFLDEPCLNFRGADPFEMHATMRGRGLQVTGQPESYEKEKYSATADGRCWLTRDPDGNVVFFDTNEAETGQEGAALALRRVLGATAKQLINVGAPPACREAFRRKVLGRFSPEAGRESTELGGAAVADTGPGTGPGIGVYAGNFVYCLKTSDLQGSRAFYLAMGLEVTGNDDEQWAQVSSGDCELSLMTFLDANWLNFRGADPFRIREQLSAAGVQAEGEPQRYTEEEFGTAAGGHW